MLKVLKRAKTYYCLCVRGCICALVQRASKIKVEVLTIFTEKQEWEPTKNVTFHSPGLNFAGLQEQHAPQ